MRRYDIAAHGGDIPDLVSADHARRLDQRTQLALERRMLLDRLVRCQRTEDETASIFLDAGEIGETTQVDQVLRGQTLAVDLNYEIGSAGDQAGR